MKNKYILLFFVIFFLSLLSIGITAQVPPPPPPGPTAPPAPQPTAPVCGNNIPETGEQCDDGNTIDCNPYPGCAADCSREQRCGNGRQECNEQCDDGNTNNNDACTNTCRSNVCGDGFQYLGFEQCDDGNTVSGDGCVNCRIEEVTTIRSCTAAGGSCKTNACSNYNRCSPVLGSCSAGVCCSGSCTERVAPTPTPSPVPTGRTVVPQSIVESILSGVEICNELYRCGDSDRICPDLFFPVEFRCFTYDFDCFYNFPRSCVEIDGTCTRECSGRADPDCMRVSALPEWCNNNVQDIAFDETGVDCGGACPTCGTSPSCSNPGVDPLECCGNGRLNRFEECDGISGCTSRCRWIATTDRYSIASTGVGIPIPPGSLLLDDGSILLPDRRILFRSGTVIPLDPREPLPTGGIPIPEGSILLPDGRILLTNGNIILPNGNLQLLDGTIIPLSAGTLLPNRNLQFPDGTIIPIVEAPSLGISPAPGQALGISTPGLGGPPGIGAEPLGMGVSNCVENVEITSSCNCGSSVVSSGYCCNSRHQILSCSECLYSGSETCDGLDNDCDNSIDEGNLCGSGEVCIRGSCQPRAACNPTNEGVECCGDNLDNDCRNGIDNICDRDNDNYIDCEAPICPGVTGITCRDLEREEREEEREEREPELLESLCNTLCERSRRLCNIASRVRICIGTETLPETGSITPTPTEVAPTPTAPTPTPATREEAAPPPPIAPGSIG